jgi:hypothetical protein
VKVGREEKDCRNMARSGVLHRFAIRLLMISSIYISRTPNSWNHETRVKRGALTPNQYLLRDSWRVS